MRNKVQGKDLKAMRVTKDEECEDLGEYTGKITNIGSKFGFIKCHKLSQQGYGDDVFVLWHELKPYKEGQVVKFTAFVDSQGRPKGKDLKPKDSMSTTPQGSTTALDSDAQF